MAALSRVFRPIWPGAVLMSDPLPGNAEIILQLSLPDAAGHGSDGARSPFEEQMLAPFHALHHPPLRYLLSLRLAPDRTEQIFQITFPHLFQPPTPTPPSPNSRP